MQGIGGWQVGEKVGTQVSNRATDFKASGMA